MGDIPINCFYINFNQIWIGTHRDVCVYTIDYKAQVFILLETLHGHTRKINNFNHPMNDEIWSCSDDGLIFVWSLSEYKKLTSMDINSGSIRCLLQINDFMWSGGSNNNIACWSIETKTPQHELEISGPAMCIAKVGTAVWAGTG